MGDFLDAAADGRRGARDAQRALREQERLVRNAAPEFRELGREAAGALTAAGVPHRWPPPAGWSLPGSRLPWLSATGLWGRVAYAPKDGRTPRESANSYFVAEDVCFVGRWINPEYLGDTLRQGRLDDVLVPTNFTYTDIEAEGMTWLGLLLSPTEGWVTQVNSHTRLPIREALTRAIRTLAFELGT